MTDVLTQAAFAGAPGPSTPVTVRAISGFYFDKKPVKEGAVLAVPRHFAIELIHTKKAIVHDPTREAPEPSVVEAARAADRAAAAQPTKTGAAK